MKLVPAVAYNSCLNLPATFSQPLTVYKYNLGVWRLMQQVTKGQWFISGKLILVYGIQIPGKRLIEFGVRKKSSY